MTKKIKGFKGFDENFKCRNFQYEENKEFKEDVKPEICKKGFHFCENPLDVFEFYPPDGKNIFAEVVANGDVSTDEKKTATNVLTVKGIISIGQMFKAAFEIVKEKCLNSLHANTSGSEAHANTSGYNAHANTSGAYAHANTSGYKAHANTSGYKAHANTSGDYAHANTSGNEAHANTSGYNAHANTSGYKAHANTSGYNAHANTSGSYAHANTSGDEAHANTSGYNAHANTSGYNAHANTSGDEAHANTSGYESIACSLGINGKAKAVNGWIVIVDWRQDENYKWSIQGIYSAKVGKKIKGVKISPDKSYYFLNGELISE